MLAAPAQRRAGLNGGARPEPKYVRRDVRNLGMNIAIAVHVQMQE